MWDKQNCRWSAEYWGISQKSWSYQIGTATKCKGRPKGAHSKIAKTEDSTVADIREIHRVAYKRGINRVCFSNSFCHMQLSRAARCSDNLKNLFKLSELFMQLFLRNILLIFDSLLYSTSIVLYEKANYSMVSVVFSSDTFCQLRICSHVVCSLPVSKMNITLYYYRIKSGLQEYRVFSISAQYLQWIFSVNSPHPP